ncbi:hypothetical protein WJX74_004814 [Apatococcus lobatus]|uniref:Uncharacterized protein n=2 Tax=Apatococcus TaxID=904362 RepID=A0AAW1SQK3_9CHLO
MLSRHACRFGRRLTKLADAARSSAVPATSGITPAVAASSSRAFATDTLNLTKEHNSHWLGYTLGGISAGGIMYYLFTHSTQTQANADGKLVAHAPTGHAAHSHLSISEFNLVDHMGQPASSDDVLGEFVLFYFGAASNPATNEAMTKLTETVRQIDRKTNMHYLTPVFISVDPKDEPIKLRGFVTKYHDRMIALSGQDANKALDSAKAFSKDTAGKSPKGSGASTDEVAHTCFLVNPEGELLASFGDEDTVINTSDAVASHISNYKLHHPSWHGPKAIKVRNA